jgi:hypothetical protein
VVFEEHGRNLLCAVVANKRPHHAAAKHSHDTQTTFPYMTHNQHSQTSGHRHVRGTNEHRVHTFANSDLTARLRSPQSSSERRPSCDAVTQSSACPPCKAPQQTVPCDIYTQRNASGAEACFETRARGRDVSLRMSVTRVARRQAPKFQCSDTSSCILLSAETRDTSGSSPQEIALIESLHPLLHTNAIADLIHLSPTRFGEIAIS